MEVEWSEERMRAFIDARIAEAFVSKGKEQMTAVPEKYTEDVTNGKEISKEESDLAGKHPSDLQLSAFEDQLSSLSQRVATLTQQYESQISDLTLRLSRVEGGVENQKDRISVIPVEKVTSPSKLVAIEKEINQVKSSLHDYYEKLTSRLAEQETRAPNNAIAAPLPSAESKQVEEVKRLHADFLEMIRTDQMNFRIKMEQKSEALSSSLNKSLLKLSEDIEQRLHSYVLAKIDEARSSKEDDAELRQMVNKHEENFRFIVENFASVKLVLLKVQEETHSSFESLQRKQQSFLFDCSEKMKSVWDTVTLLSQSLLAVERLNTAPPTMDTITGTPARK